MKIVIGADHRGYRYKISLINRFSLAGHNIEWIDVGAFNESRTNYPTFAKAACEKMKNGQADLGVLICGTGVGMAITANRYDGIYAAPVWNDEVAKLSREHDNVNVLVIPSDFVTEDEMHSMVAAWLGAKFLEGPYKERMSMIDAL